MNVYMTWNFTFSVCSTFSIEPRRTSLRESVLQRMQSTVVYALLKSAKHTRKKDTRSACQASKSVMCTQKSPS